MKNKLTKAIALMLAASITLTSCGGENSKNSDNGNWLNNVFSGAETSAAAGETSAESNIFPVDNDDHGNENNSNNNNFGAAQVTDETYSINDKEGKYTGNWVNGRPEGTGELKISDDEYYKGEWSDGKLSGNVELLRPYGDGSYIYYKGEYNNNGPSGKGDMYVQYANNCGHYVVEGDFSDYSSLVWRSFDRDEFPEAFGVVANDGSLVTYADYNEKTGIDRIEKGIPAHEIDRRYNGGNAWSKLFEFKGKYYGPVDRNGAPNGYGYFEGKPAWHSYYCDDQEKEFYLIDEYNGQFETEEYAKDHYGYYKYDMDDKVGKVDAKLYGTWQNGKLVGKYYVIYYLAETGEEVEKYCAEWDDNGKAVGSSIEVKLSSSEQTYYGEEVLRNKDAGRSCEMTVKKMNADSFSDFKPNDDGVYCCSGYEVEEYYTDGGMGWYHVYCYLQKPSDKNSWKYVGSCQLFDKDGNVVKEQRYYDGMWMTEQEINDMIRKEKEKKQKEQLTMALTLGLMAAGIAFIYYDAKRFNEKIQVQRELSNKAMMNNLERDRLIKEGKYEEASKMPIMCAPSALDCVF